MTTPQSTVEKDRRFVTALSRGLEILTCFQPEETYLGNRQIADRTGLPKPTVSRLTYTLTQLGYLDFAEDHGKYSLGATFLDLGYSQLTKMKERQVARPLMQALAEYSQGSVNFAVRKALSMVYIDTYRTSSTLTLQLEAGSQIPLATSAMGRAYLCTVPSSKRMEILESIKESNPEQWPVVKQGIDTAMEQFEEKGYCLSLGGWRKETYAVAVPLDTGITTAGAKIFSCGGPSFLFTKEKLENDLGPRLLNLVGNVQTALQVSDSSLI